ncbi:MAG: cytoskeleton protein RodZ [Colwellia sp.]|jgi:cytoskeleton protein RodZ
MNPIEKNNHVAKEKTDSSQNKALESAPEELSEDMEVMGPGQILSDARKKMGLSQDEVAARLNFRTTLVDEIENEVFDTSMPETFNRGYLRNYAKLVNVSQEDVMASYEQLNVAKTQASELQSFSKGTEKLAESNRIMWVSYLILAILIGSTVVWWMQNNTEQALKETTTSSENQKTDLLNDNQVNETLTPPVESIDAENIPVEKTDIDDVIEAPSAPLIELNQDSSNVTAPVTQIENVQVNAESTTQIENILESEPEVILTNVTFTFSGDCWVNISDATGERIAWGVKKLGYVMKISGQAPFNVTLGRPELVAINFSDEIIDMSQFNAGNIAKFTLPVSN